MTSHLDADERVRLRKQYLDVGPDITLRRRWMRVQVSELDLARYLANGWEFDESQ